MNDFLIPSNDQKEKRFMRGRHFVLFFNKYDRSFYVRDLGTGYGIFRIIWDPLIIEQTMIVNMGETYLVLNSSFNTEEEA